MVQNLPDRQTEIVDKEISQFNLKFDNVSLSHANNPPYAPSSNLPFVNSSPVANNTVYKSHWDKC